MTTETGERLPAVVGGTGDSFTVVKRRRPPAIDHRAEGIWAQVPVVQLGGIACLDLSGLALRTFLLLAAGIKMGNDNCVPLSTGSAASALGIPDQRSRLRRALRELASAGLIVQLPQSGNSTASYMLDPLVLWVGDKDERRYALDLFCGLRRQQVLRETGATDVDLATGELFFAPTLGAQQPSLAPGEVDRCSFIDVPLPLDTDPLADYDPSPPTGYATDGRRVA